MRVGVTATERPAGVREPRFSRTAFTTIPSGVAANASRTIVAIFDTAGEVVEQRRINMAGFLGCDSDVLVQS